MDISTGALISCFVWNRFHQTHEQPSGLRFVRALLERCDLLDGYYELAAYGAACCISAYLGENMLVDVWLPFFRMKR